MNLNHDVHSSPKEENFLNGSIDDFTDCIDFTKQYQKSCGYEENNIDGLGDLNTNESKESVESENDKGGGGSGGVVGGNKFGSSEGAQAIESGSVLGCDELGRNEGDGEREEESESEGGHRHPMEPDVSITVGETNLEKTINNVAKGNDVKEKSSEFKSNSEGFKKKLGKQKLVKKNHLKLPVGKTIKKNGSLFKLKNGKYVKKKNESFQYQGIQSNIKFKCYKCSYSEFSSISELQIHQRKCITGADLAVPSESANASTSNFRITRKVYLCSACGSYYENWNLFLHMKEIHKRHICLYCLGMFSQPDKLAQHLQAKHGVVEQNFSSGEEFFKFYRGTCYLVCVACEAMFSEQEDFHEHSCASQSDDASHCPLCGLQGAHFPTCRRAFSDRYVEPEAEKSHPAFGKKLNSKKKKVKGPKKTKDVFRIVNNEHNGEMSVIVRKQNASDGDAASDSRSKDSYCLGKDDDITSPLRNSSEDLKQYNEKMLQLYRPSKPPEKIISSIQSIEDSINRVVENSRISDEDEKEIEGEEEDRDANCVPDPEEDFERDNLSSADHSQPLDAEIVRNEDSSADTEYKQTEKPEADLTNGAGDDSQLASDSESTDSEKLTIAFDQPGDQAVESEERDGRKGGEKGKEKETESVGQKSEDNVPTASVGTPYISVTIKEECDGIKTLIREFVKVSCWNCVYCSHSKRIAVNGKQLALHILAEHRFVTVPEESTVEEKERSALDVIQKLKCSLSSLNNCYFNTDTFDSEDKEFWKPNDRIYECFHCLFATYVHKELYSHNRKMHQKAVFLCIMCKSNFYNYSELLCHLCPGIYISGQVINPDITYRCFLCSVDPLPSSFRLMVHLRRRHNSCDICFDLSANQFQLSTHVWKHKLSHMCYRCGIAYRNKPDITKHLFWKHGTESVLCKKCLQKKWPHVYHFCVPPNSFICDECSVSLKSAVALKVHKRLHSGDRPYACTKCDEKFISRKLLAKHLNKHDEEENRPPAPPTPETVSAKDGSPTEEPKAELGADPGGDAEVSASEDAEKKPEKEKKPKKRKVLTDVFDLPPVNLSESDDSDQEEAELKPNVFKANSPSEETLMANGFLNGDVQKEEPSPTQIVDGVWNNFQNYLVAKDMPKTFRPGSPFKNMTLSRIKEIMLSDHDYHIIPTGTEGQEAAKGAEGEKAESKKAGLDHDYCNNVPKQKASHKTKQKTKHREDSKSSSSDSSSDSDSSCSCGSNCSCSSGSSSSTSSNDSDSDSREKRKQKKSQREGKVANEVEAEVPTEVDISVHDVSTENLIRESDLETDETETDEDFYDYNPAREANRILAEKRTQLLANLNGSDTVVSSPSIVAEKPQSPKKKTKFKKKRSQYRANNAARGNRKKNPPATLTRPLPADSSLPLTPNLTPSSTSKPPYDTPTHSYSHSHSRPEHHADSDSRRPKRKRVPLKFYGFSSDDDNEAGPLPRKRDKYNAAENNTTIPAPLSNPSTPALGTPDTPPTIWNPHSKASLSWRVEKSDTVTPKVNPIKIRTSQGGGALLQEATSGGEALLGLQAVQGKRPERSVQVNGNSGGVVQTAHGSQGATKGEKLYCFCQCPYDEVSEMIACDAEDCVIEWFHFECVGIMVPPKGSWYCPDCRKKLAAENEFLAQPLSEQNVN